MRFSLLFLALIPLTMGNDRIPQVNGVKIEEQLANPDAKRRTTRGDTVDVHYRGTLEKDGSEFDSSYNRGQPLSFTVGKGQVIKGYDPSSSHGILDDADAEAQEGGVQQLTSSYRWDEGLLNMAPGEKRLLTIQPEAGYGSRAMGPIPANSVLSMLYPSLSSRHSLYIANLEFSL